MHNLLLPQSPMLHNQPSTSLPTHSLPVPSTSQQGGPEGVGPNSASGLRFRRGPNDATPEIDVNLLVTLVRYGGDDLLGVLSRKHRMLYEVRTSLTRGPILLFPDYPPLPNSPPFGWMLTLASLLGTLPRSPASSPALLPLSLPSPPISLSCRVRAWTPRLASGVTWCRSSCAATCTRWSTGPSTSCPSSSKPCTSSCGTR